MQKPRTFVFLFAFALIVIAAGLLVTGLSEIKSEFGSRSWHSTPGAIIDAQTRHAIEQYLFSYSISGIRYQARFERLSIPFTGAWSRGDSVLVFYDPESAGNATLSQGLRFDGGILNILSGIGLLAFALMILRAIRKWNSPSA